MGFRLPLDETIEVWHDDLLRARHQMCIFGLQYMTLDYVMSQSKRKLSMRKTDEIRDVYDRIADDYKVKRENPETATWNDLLEAPAIDSVLEPIVKGRRVLDLGCGYGLVTQKIFKWGGHAVGVDISENMIALARQENPEVEFRVGQLNHLPFDDQTFDIVASSLVMHYVKELGPGFAEVARILRPGGDFVFTMHHPMNEAFEIDKSTCDGRPVLQPYFHNDLYYWRMCGTDIPSFHHTFEDVIKNLKSAGLVLHDLTECRPDKSLADSFADYEITSQYPTFCLFHAKEQHG